MKLNEIFMRDPFVYVENDTLYLIGTTDTTAWSGKAKGFLGYKSKDMINFDGPFVLFENSDDFWANENFWAPELHKVGNKYYIIASFKEKGHRRASQALVSDEPFGKYKALEKPFTPEEWECLDATLYEENNVLYTIFCHEWTQIRDGEMCIARLNKDLTSIEGSVDVLFKASDAKWVVSLDHKMNFVTDGPYIYKMKDNSLLLLWSSVCKDGYAIGMAKSVKGIKGPYVHLDKPLFSKNGGHGMVFTFKGKNYLTFHSPNSPFLSERPIFYEIEETNDKIQIKN